MTDRDWRIQTVLKILRHGVLNFDFNWENSYSIIDHFLKGRLGVKGGGGGGEGGGGGVDHAFAELFAVLVQRFMAGKHVRASWKTRTMILWQPHLVVESMKTLLWSWNEISFQVLLCMYKSVYFIKDRYIPMDMTVVLDLHKFNLQVTIDHRGPSIYSSHYTASIDCCKRRFYCNDSKITKFEIINDWYQKPSTAW